ncbi:MAG: sulfide/dihydroorotate dehydrogenase-like FAD/NAD-binding protein [Carboxylicivirga sp.]|jgi:NAD(P)H-flavin reductase|nr:sulfide/dihydroorotate dehydrogenase-like FAD/NAD-binding protein [Carboxylicivirga sp.]
MGKIVRKEYLSQNIVELEIESPLIAKAARAGHFVIVRIGEKGERIPLTIKDTNPNFGTISLVVQRMGVSSSKLCDLKVRDEITDLVGPLGEASEVEKVGTILACGGGLGAAPLLPIIKAHKEAGNRVIVVLASRNKDLLILEKETAAWADELIIMTDDGSYGHKGLVTQGMQEVLNREKIDQAIVIGPAIMMKFASSLTKEYEVPTIASLNCIMVDGTGMCGACRVTVGGRTRFTCIDGPEFDAHQVDFNEVLKRLGAYKGEEMKGNEQYKCAAKKGR